MGDKEAIYRLAHIDDLIIKALRYNMINTTDYLTPAEQLMVENILNKEQQIKYLKIGGYDHAERMIFCIYPYYLDIDYYKVPIKVIKIEWDSRYYKLGHRHILGTLMGLGIKREKIGDIITGSGAGYVFVISDIVPFILSNMVNVGKVSVLCKSFDYDQIEIPAPKTKIINTTVPSMRLDAIASAGFGLSRTKMVPYIKSGSTKVNWLVVDRPDSLLSIGDLVSIRGLGRVKLKDIVGTTKKERISILLERFV